MSLPLIFACLWAVLATLIAIGPQRFHWPAAWALIVVGIPILGWVTWIDGPVLGLIVLAAGMSVLRWPMRFALRGILARIRGS